VIKIQLPIKKRVLILAVSEAGIIFIQELVNQGKPVNEIFLVVDSVRIPKNLNLLPDGVVIYYLDAQDGESLQLIADKENANVCCVFAWYAILQKRFIDSFGGCIFNMHFGSLPLFRGAGGFSWQVLNGAEELGAFIHQLTPKVDAGAIVCSVESKIPVSEPYPKDFIDLSIGIARAVSIEFARMLHVSHFFDAKEQDESLAEYFPKLTTAENGKIDFRCLSQEVIRFIRAFSYPYAGASFNYEGENIHVYRAKLIKTGISRHPFCVGLIVNRSACGLHVMLRDGVIALQDFRSVKGDRIECEKFRIGSRVFNSQQELEEALLYRPKV